jgi:4-oxalocrotonate tautomerase
MPYVLIQVTDEGVTRDQKRALVEGATELLVRVLQKDPQTTFVVIDEVSTDNWGVAGELVTERRRRGSTPRHPPAE